MSHDEVDDIRSYSIASDLSMAPFLPISTGSYYQKKWSPHFLAEHFLEQHKDLELETFAQSPEQLKQYGSEISNM